MPQKFDIDFTTPQTKDKFKRIASTQRATVRLINDYADDLKDEEQSYEAYRSNSWPKDVKQQRETEELPVSDVARFSSIVDTISGNERQNRTEMFAFALEKDDQLTADVANFYLKYRNRKDKQWHEDSLAFTNGCVSKRAHFEFFLQNNPVDGSLETIRVERPSDEVFVGRPFRKIDASDAPELVHMQWVLLDEVKEKFKGKIPDVSLLDFTPKEKRPRTEISHLLDDYDFADDETPETFHKNEEGKKFVRVIRRWQKWTKTIYRVTNPAPEKLEDVIIEDQDGENNFPSRQKARTVAREFIIRNPEIVDEYLNDNVVEGEDGRITEVSGDTIEKVADEFILEQTKPVYSFHAISGRVELDWKKEFGDFLPWTHFYCYFIDGKPGGLFERIKDLIYEINFIHAKLQERLGTVGKMPVFIEKGALSVDRETAKDNFRDGGFVEVEDNAIRQSKLLVVEDKTLSSIPAFIGLEESLNNTIKEMTGANDALQGKSPGANTAGITIDLLQRKGAALIQPILDNYKRFKMDNASMEIKMLCRAHKIRPNWTTLKVIKIIGGMIENTGGQTTELGQTLVAGGRPTGNGRVVPDPIFERTLINDILRNMESMEYDFTLDEFLQTPSMRMAYMALLIDILVKIGGAADPRIVIEESELPQHIKDKLIGFQGTAEAQQQLQARQPQGGGAVTGELSNILQ